MEVALGALLGAVVAALAVYAAVRGRTAPATAPAAATTHAPDTAAADAAARAAAAAEHEARAAAAAEAAEREARAVLDRATADADRIRRDAESAAAATAATAAADARAVAAEAQAQAEADARAQRADLDRREERLAEREQRLAEREERLDAEQRRLEQRAAELAEAEADVQRRRDELKDVEEERRLVLERTAGMTAADAKAELVATIENQAKRDAVAIVRDIEKQAQDQGDERARKIVTLAIQRVASEQTAESVVSVLHLPSDDMKGRIIGREGRNIRAYESITGVNLIIDDTPEAVLLSCFDPVRREIGRLTLDKLVLDGRIHPQRIEEMYERSKAEVEQLVVRAGEDALYEVGITEMHPEIVNLLGRLKYRTSYGQNVLRHLVEAAHIAGVMAAELKLDVPLVKRCTVLHDLGKALTHEVEGSHALIGAEIARKYGESEDVAHAIEAHHGEVEQRTVEAVLTQSADAISGGRPGARRESLESYVQRLERLEEIATSKPGVEKVFAMQAGREIRVMVLPDQVDDIQAQVIARDIAKQVEEELTYPGQIRVTVVRESRATEYAK
ncbi:MAG TPA: ribonuclease Y [Frankiaceae bacterium]|nr:ribonuclease Y [Frankiaceae bacterium]